MANDFYGFDLDKAEFDSLLKKLKNIGKITAKPLVNKAINEALKPALETARSLIPVDTGLSKRSLGIKLQVYTNSGAATGWVGARAKFVEDRGVFTKGKNKGKPRRHRPSKILHLLEFGTNHSNGHFMITQAYYQNREAAVQIFLSYIKAELERITK